MPAPTFVNKSAFASGTAALSVGAVASVVADDLLLLFVESANQAISTPAGGWVEAPSSPQFTGTAAAAGGVRLAVFYLWATGADGTTTVADTGDHTTAIKMAFRGVNRTTPFNANAGSTQAATTAMSFPAVTTTVNECLIVLGCAQDTDAASTATSGTPTNANLTSLTERHDQTVTSGVGGGLVVLTGVKDTAGNTGATTSTGSTSVTHAYVTLALAPKPPVTGSMSTTETGLDTLAGTGDVIVKGSMSSTETGLDTFSASGSVTDANITGSMSATETGADTLSGTGDVIVRGSLSVSETGNDTAAGQGKVIVKGALTATESGNDTLSGSGFLVSFGSTGSMAVTETGVDTLAASGKVVIRGSLAVSEVGQDTATASGKVRVSGQATLTEAGTDTFLADGFLVLLPIVGSMSATEAGPDTTGSYAVAGYVEPDYYESGWFGRVIVSGYMAATESGNDSFYGTSSAATKLWFGATRVAKAYLGATQVSKVYFGSTRVL